MNKTESLGMVVGNEFHNFAPRDLINDDEDHDDVNHDNSFSTYFDNHDFNLDLCNEEIVYTEGAAPDATNSPDAAIRDAHLWNTDLSKPTQELRNTSPASKSAERHRTFSRAKALASHARIHASASAQETPSDQTVAKYQCRNCDRSFSAQRVLVKHFVKCIKQPWGSVRQCRRPDKSKAASSDTRKMKTTKAAKPNQHQCEQCKKAFATKQKMYRHMWIHRKKAFTCEVCATSFGKQCELDEHRLRQHAENSRYVCSECGKNFTSRQGLWEHNRTHSVQRSIELKCDQCPKSFSSRQGYAIHTRTHTGERPFDCSYCNKSFRDGGTLRKHQRIHTGERPHKCPLCEKNFNQKVVLREHVRWVHAFNKSEYPEASPFECALCTTSLTDREELCSHIVKHSDQIAAFNKENGDGIDLISPKPSDRPDKPPIGAKYDVDVVHRNRVILSRYQEGLFRPIRSIAKVADSAETTTKKHDCSMCTESFSSMELLCSHASVHL